MATATATHEATDRPLTPEQIERELVRECLPGDKQSSSRWRRRDRHAIGAIMCVSNVYVGLKIG